MKGHPSYLFALMSYTLTGLAYAHECSGLKAGPWSQLNDLLLTEIYRIMFEGYDFIPDKAFSLMQNKISKRFAAWRVLLHQKLRILYRVNVSMNLQRDSFRKLYLQHLAKFAKRPC